MSRPQRILLASGIGMVLLAAGLLAAVLASKATTSSVILGFAAGTLAGGGIYCATSALVD